MEVSASAPIKSSSEYKLERLGFLADWMGRDRVKQKTVAENAGVTRVTVYLWFERDDIKVATLMKIVNSFGKTLKVTIEGERDGIDVHTVLKVPGSSGIGGEVLLNEIMGSLGLTYKKLADLTKTTYQNIKERVGKGLTTLSSVEEYAKLAGYKIEFDIL